MNKCYRCVLKHITTALALLHETEYPNHQWQAIGQLVLAEWECEKRIGPEIRAARLAVEESLITGVDCIEILEALIPVFRQKLDADVGTDS